MTSKLKIKLETNEFSKSPKSCWKSLFGDRDWVDITSVFLLPLIGAVWVGFQYRNEINRQYNDTLDSYFTSLQSLENDILKYELSSEIEADKKTAEAESLIQSLALAKTLLVLQNLDPSRKGQVIQYLHNAGLVPVRFVNYDSGQDLRCREFKEDKGLINLKQVPISEPKIKAKLENFNLTENSFLPGIKLEEIAIDYFNFTGVNLHCSSFTDSTITNTNFTGANLREADFSRAYLGQVDFLGAWLSGANFSEVKLVTTDRLKALSRGNYKPLLRGNYLRLNKAILTDANLSNANLNNASFTNTDLSNSVLLATDFRNAKNLQAAQLTGDKPPLLCNVKLPNNITDIDPNRDCDKIPKALVNQFPQNQSYRSLGNRDELLSLEEATQLVNKAKQKKWD